MRAFSPRAILIVPMPLHKNRVRSRGFNQIEKVLARLPAEFRDGSLSKVSTKALVRTRDTPQQAHLSRPERLKNVAGAFAADTTDVGGTHVILVDDVTTTGATLAECVKTLKSAGAQVTPLALARA
jgi:ComF family protein